MRSTPRIGSSDLEPVFLEPSGRRWAAFQMLAGLAVLSGLLAFASLTIRSLEDPVLPSLDLAINPRIVAVPRTADLPNDLPLFSGRGAADSAEDYRPFFFGDRRRTRPAAALTLRRTDSSDTSRQP